MHSMPARAVAVALALLAAPVARAAGAPAVKVAQKDGVGRYLTDADGKALYVFKKDSPGQSACAGDCAPRS